MVKESAAEFTGTYVKKTQDVFYGSYKRAMTKTVEFIYGKCFELAPVGKTRKGAVNLRNALIWEVDLPEGAGYIGLPKGSQLEKIGFYTEMGVGERGLTGWQQFYNEKKPNFTVPIVPLKAKAMHFINEKGDDVFLKTSKGQKPQSWMRRGFKKSEPLIDKIWKKEFSSENVLKHSKKEKV